MPATALGMDTVPTTCQAVAGSSTPTWLASLQRVGFAGIAMQLGQRPWQELEFWHERCLWTRTDVMSPPASTPPVASSSSPFCWEQGLRWQSLAIHESRSDREAFFGCSFGVAAVIVAVLDFDM